MLILHICPPLPPVWSLRVQAGQEEQLPASWVRPHGGAGVAGRSGEDPGHYWPTLRTYTYVFHAHQMGGGVLAASPYDAGLLGGGGMGHVEVQARAADGGGEETQTPALQRRYRSLLWGRHAGPEAPMVGEKTLLVLRQVHARHP